jgi:hypothetical protein
VFAFLFLSDNVRIYAVEISGRLRLPEISIFLVVIAGFAGNYHKKSIILGGFAALQTSLRG